MCIRDSVALVLAATACLTHAAQGQSARPAPFDVVRQDSVCLLYTSDAADERSSVDLGGRRIIKKKKKEHTGSCVVGIVKRKNKSREVAHREGED